MAMQPPCTPSEKREHSSRAARAITSAFQVHQRWVQTAGCSKKDQATEMPEDRALNDDLVAGTATGMLSTLHILNFQVALQQKDPNARALLLKLSDLDSIEAAQLHEMADECFTAGSRCTVLARLVHPSRRAVGNTPSKPSFTCIWLCAVWCAESLACLH